MKPDKVNIIQINTIKAPTQWWLSAHRADAFIEIFGLGDDGNIYKWGRSYNKSNTKMVWCLFED